MRAAISPFAAVAVLTALALAPARAEVTINSPGATSWTIEREGEEGLLFRDDKGAVLHAGGATVVIDGGGSGGGVFVEPPGLFNAEPSFGAEGRNTLSIELSVSARPGASPAGRDEVAELGRSLQRLSVAAGRQCEIFLAATGAPCRLESLSLRGFAHLRRAQGPRNDVRAKLEFDLPWPLPSRPHAP